MQVTKYVVFISLLLVAFSTEAQQDSILYYDEITPIEIRDAKSVKVDKLELLRAHFLSAPGAFDDPSRLLQKYAGIANLNDQSNFVIYHGLGPQFHTWRLYGAKILNPNHLGNAGTLTDLPSRTAGGVNMLSGQVLGKLEFYSAPSFESKNSLAAVSDLTLRSAYKNTVTTNVGLIGMEAGLDRTFNNGKQNLIVNYRYSTVGILTGLGLDFGGEKINYQDLTLKYENKLSSNKKLNFYGSFGMDSNKKGVSQDSVLLEIKDYQDIDYNGITALAGFNYNVKNDNSEWNATLNTSIKNLDRSSSQQFPISPVSIQSNYKNNELQLAGIISRTHSSGKFNQTFIFRPEYYKIDLLYSLPRDIDDLVVKGNVEKEISYDYGNFGFQYIGSYQISKSLKIGVSLTTIYNTLNSSGFDLNVLPAGIIEYTVGDFYASIQASISNQIYEPEVLLYTGVNEINSNNKSLILGYKDLKLNLFTHNIFNIPSLNKGYLYSGLDDFDYLPYDSDFGFEDVEVNTNGRIEITGASLSYQKRIATIDTRINATILDSDRRAAYIYSHMINIILSKRWKISDQKQLGLSISAQHRSGGYQHAISVDKSLDWGYTQFEDDGGEYVVELSDYFRSDLRFFIKKTRKNGTYSTFSVDIQNLTSRQNEAYFYYEPVTQIIKLKRQLGMIPVISWRSSF